MKNWIKTMLFVSALCLAACSDDPDVAPLKRDTDAVELTYNSGATTQISVRYAGSWSARVECTDGSGAPVNNWFSVSPDNGVGNGRDYQWVTVTAERNPGDKRTGYIYLKPANGEEIKIEYTGLRPGEKLYEEVLSNTENTIPTTHDRIRIAKVREYDYAEACAATGQLEQFARMVNVPDTVCLMKKIVPEFKSKNSEFERFDKVQPA